MEIKKVKSVKVGRVARGRDVLKVHIPIAVARILDIKAGDVLSVYVLRVNGKEFVAFSKN